MAIAGVAWAVKLQSKVPEIVRTEKEFSNSAGQRRKTDRRINALLRFLVLVMRSQCNSFGASYY
jgi:hypothetical protein